MNYDVKIIKYEISIIRFLLLLYSDVECVIVKVNLKELGFGLVLKFWDVFFI